MTAGPAQEIRAAAQRLRDAARAATINDRTTWRLNRTGLTRTPVITDHPTGPTVLVEAFAEHHPAVNTYLATFASPATALAVADLLHAASLLADEQPGSRLAAAATAAARTLAATSWEDQP